jgi:hypothetical protein
MFNSPFGYCEEEFDDFDTDDFIKEQNMVVPDEGCCIGDHVVCKTREHVLVTRFEKYDDKITFTVVGRHSNGQDTYDYVVYIPEYEAASIKGAFSIRPSLAEAYGVDKKYIGDLAIIIRKNNIVSIAFKADGLSCKRCKEFFRMAKSNQEDGTLLCYLCRERPYR